MLYECSNLMAKFDKIVKPLLIFVSLIGLALIVSEYVVYYLVIFQCSWPDLNQEIAREELGQIGESAWLFEHRASASPLPRSVGGDNNGEAVGLRGAEAHQHERGENTAGDVESLRAFFIADTHLLGSRFGHWFDKLRR